MLIKFCIRLTLFINCALLFINHPQFLLGISKGLVVSQERVFLCVYAGLFNFPNFLHTKKKYPVKQRKFAINIVSVIIFSPDINISSMDNSCIAIHYFTFHISCTQCLCVCRLQIKELLKSF